MSDFEESTIKKVEKQIEEITMPAIIESAVTIAAQSAPIKYEFIGLPEGRIEYGGNYAIAANPTPTRLLVDLVYLDKNANEITIDRIESDGSTLNLIIPAFIRRKAKHYKQGNYEIRCYAYDADGNESRASVKVVLDPPGSEAERRWR